MGGKAKIILPLIALGIGAAATGGFGLAGAGAATSTSGVVGSTVASNVITSAGLTSTAASLVPASAGALALGGAAAGVGTAASLAGGIDAAVAAAVPLGGVAETGFFSTLASEFSAMSGLEQAGLGLQGLSAVGTGAGALINSNAQKAALAAQESEKKLSQAASRLDIANAELDSQKRLRKTISTQTNFFAATGVNASTGSASRVADAATGEAGQEMDLLKTRRDLLNKGATNVGASFAIRRRQASLASTGAGIGSLLDFGGDAFAALNKRRRLA